MKIKLSKTQWQKMGKEAGWMDKTPGLLGQNYNAKELMTLCEAVSDFIWDLPKEEQEEAKQYAREHLLAINSQVEQNPPIDMGN